MDRHRWWVAILVAAASACSGGDSGGAGDRPGSASGPVAAGTSGGGSSAPSAGSASSDFGNATMPAPDTSSGPPPMMRDPDAGCAAVAVEAEQVVVEEMVTVEETIEEVQPVALYIVLDQSSSMNSGGLWVPATDAIRSFVTDPGSEGIDVALEFFPPNTDAVLWDPTGAGFGDCTGAGYDMPAAAMGRLPDHAPNVTAELDLRPLAAGMGTPIEGGMRGGIRFCEQFEASSNGEKCVVVLITDGAPGECAVDFPTLAAIAGTAFDGGMGVRTFAVGLQGADFSLLDQIAMMGGAVDCDEQDAARFSCDVSGGPDQLATALAKIREVVTTVETRTEIVTKIEEVPLECEWQIPEPPVGESLDPERVNVVLTGSSTDDVTLGNVPTPEDCAAMGWYYDKPTEPTRIIACEETCTTIQSTMGASVSIQLGCATQVLQ